MSLLTIDANVLVYSIEEASPKQAAAVAIITRAGRNSCALTLQALGEFFFVATRKRKLPFDQAITQVGNFRTLFGVPVAGDWDSLSQAMQAVGSGRFSFWDAMLLAAAEAAGCTAIISEDMAPGARLGRIRVVSAFAGDAISPQAQALLA